MQLDNRELANATQENTRTYKRETSSKIYKQEMSIGIRYGKYNMKTEKQELRVTRASRSHSVMVLRLRR